MSSNNSKFKMFFKLPSAEQNSKLRYVLTLFEQYYITFLKKTTNTFNFKLLTFNLRSGFTLVELLVVISIVAILSVIGITVYTGVQKNARDAARRSDIEAIGSALEARYTLGTTTPYPAPSGDWFNSGAIPKDPKGTDYYWNGANDICSVSSPPSPNSPATGFGTAGLTYTICAQLENTGGNSSTTGSGSTFTPVATSSAGICYCRKNLQ